MAKRSQAEKVHDRLSSDLPINSRVAVAIVDDPYSQVGEKIQVIRSIRNDPLAALHSRRQIDDAQMTAGRKWQALYEGAEVGSIRAIDPGKEAVDGGGIIEPITDHQIKSLRGLKESKQALGMEGYILVRDILAESLTMAQAAQKRGMGTEPEVKYIGRRFRECLETLAILWGLAGAAR